ncbi:SMI1/KNR4 family protein [Actinomadura alba]|uniref:SMI1/KNR4 family protein n=1 Tax=Actinomadura alba TaxID=406431 RepID=A0ABR7LNU1_9ACTN|nr:SMI1/KNR4 family protein [Actinomadura alba]MBC6466517.1 SMI1/KNR4 family protein [Actinomadura alba]
MTSKIDDEPPNTPTAADLRDAGRALAATIQIIPEDDRGWEPRFPDVPFPDDYVALISRTGPGTLAGILRLLAPGCGNGSERFDGFDLETEQRRHVAPHEKARLWGVFSSGETCWWLPIHRDPARWLLVVSGNGDQQLNITTAEFLTEWLDGRLDMPVLSLPPVPRERALTRAGHTAAALAPVPVQEATRDPLAQLLTIIGPGTPRTYDWEAIERDLGVTRLPTDYKRLHEAYKPRVALNGIFVAEPADLASMHQLHTALLRNWCEDDDRPEDADPQDYYTVHPDPGGLPLLFCASTEGRDILCWDTANPDPDKWPIVNVSFGGPDVFDGTLTEVLVGELTRNGDGFGLTSFELGDPAEWAWPIWGPRARE